MVGKVVVSAVSLILVVGVVIGVVATVHRNGGRSTENLSPQMKAVQDFCSSTEFQDRCQKTLSTVNSTDPKEFISTAILSTQEAVKKFFNSSDSFIAKANNSSRTKMALEDCKDMMTFAIQSLQASISEVGDAQLHNMTDRIADLRTWLSAVISYQQSCLDGFQDTDSTKQTMKQGMDEADQITTNALTIVTKLAEILKKFGFEFQVPTSRRLLSTRKDGYPSWFSAADRKLLARVDNGNIKPNAVVAKDGSGQHKTIAEALAAYPKGFQGRYVIYVKAGIYDEYILVESHIKNVLMYGDGPRKTIVTGRKSVAGGFSTWRTATFSAIGSGFICKSMGFQNTAGPEGHQAVALRVQSDMSAFFNCRIEGYQDTLYTQAQRQFYRNCVISGTVDFIFGDSPVVIQNSQIIVRRPMDSQQNIVTASGKYRPDENTGLVIHNCEIVPEDKLFPDRFKIKTYLGRPWKELSKTIIMESTLGDFIQPEGYMPWSGNFGLDTLYYAEYNNRGPGADTARRVNWKGFHVIDRQTALQYTVGPFLLSKENWLPATGIPFDTGLIH